MKDNFICPPDDDDLDECEDGPSGDEDEGGCGEEPMEDDRARSTLDPEVRVVYTRIINSIVYIITILLW